MANPVGLPHPFEPSAARGQRTSDKIDWHQSPIPALTNPPIRTQSQYYRTRLCDRFKSGFCPKGGNCNFAHTIEELRLPKGGDGSVLFPVEDRNPRNPNEHSGLINEQILHQANNYNSEMGPYDVKCAFARVQPGLIQYNSLVHQKSLSWKTKICHKWQISGNCPYGDQCCYAHGDAELRKNGGHHDKFVVKKVIDVAPSNYSRNVGDNVLSKKTMTVLEESSSALEYGKEIRVLSLKKINRIYGDWIDDLV